MEPKRGASLSLVELEERYQYDFVFGIHDYFTVALAFPITVGGPLPCTGCIFFTHLHSSPQTNM